MDGEKRENDHRLVESAVGLTNDELSIKLILFVNILSYQFMRKFHYEMILLSIQDIKKRRFLKLSKSGIDIVVNNQSKEW